MHIFSLGQSSDAKILQNYGHSYIRKDTDKKIDFTRKSLKMEIKIDEKFMKVIGDARYNKFKKL